MFQLPVPRTTEFMSVVELLYLISYLCGPFVHIMHGCGSVLSLVCMGVGPCFVLYGCFIRTGARVFVDEYLLINLS